VAILFLSNDFPMLSCPIHRGNNTILYSSVVNQDEVQWLSSPNRYATNGYYVGCVSWGAYFHDSFMWMTWNWNWRVYISIMEPHSSQTDKWAPSMWIMLAKGFHKTVHIIIVYSEKFINMSSLIFAKYIYIQGAAA
jgi:hypothetical protein